MNRTRLTTALIALTAAAGLGSQAAIAGTTTATFPVTATVNANCTVSAAGLSFGTYDPLVANASSPLNATNALTLACVKGVSPTVGLDTGTHGPNASGTTRAMAGGASYLSYELYKDAARTQVWGNSGTGLLTIAAVNNTNPFNVTVYGAVPGAQGVPTGSYTDTVTATVNF